MTRTVFVALMLCAITACRDTAEGIRLQFVGSYAFTPTERRTVGRIASQAAIDARRHLPGLARQITLQVASGKAGGEKGIRTLGTVSRTHAFQACSFNHSDISPFRINHLRAVE